jgi:endonuclease/exonuclease/phosphatase family metal-dependent hydrolase
MEDYAAALPHSRSAEHHFEPIVVNRPPLGSRSTLKIVAFNARSGRHLHGILKCLRQPPLSGADILLLSEVDWQHPRSFGREIAAELAAEFGMSFAFVGEFATPRRWGPPRSFLGNAILSSRPLVDVYPVPLPSSFLRPRIRRLIGVPTGLIAKVVVNGRVMSIGVAHLNSRWDPAGRDFQMREFLATFPPDGPAIIGGDLNTTTVDMRENVAMLAVARHLLRNPRRFRAPEPWEPLFERLAEANFTVDGANAPGKPTFTFSRAIPPLIRPKLDWIALRGLEPVPGSAAVITARPSFFASRVSDHDFVVCDVRI